MKNAFLIPSRTCLEKTHVFRYFLIFSFLFLCSLHNTLHAQARLSIQGILKKGNGEAVPDDSYTLTFRLYNSLSATVPQAIWTETQSDVDVTSGIYSTTLGNVTPLTVPFNVDYYLGVTVGAGVSEMTPRIQLTSAPYALSLRGQTNQFPSSGIVLADSIRAAGGVLARGGTPGANGSNKNGFAFTGNNGDKDSGLFSTAAGKVSLYVNNVEEVLATPDSVVINGEVHAEDLRLDNAGKVSYNGLDDWRLVEIDDFETDAEGWKYYSSWNSGSGTNASVTTFTDAFAGKAIVNGATNRVFKKKFTLPGSSVAGTYKNIKVVFKYHYLDSWDFRAEEKAYGAFSTTEDCTELSIGWVEERSFTSFGWGFGNGAGNAFGQAANYYGPGGASAYSDQWTTQSMTARYPSGAANTDFWLIFGGTSDEDITLENFAIGPIEIWVK